MSENSKDLLGMLMSEPKAKMLEALFVTGKTIGQTRTELIEANASTFADVLDTLTVADIVGYSKAGSKPRAAKVDHDPIKDFKDDAVRAAWKQEVVALLTQTGLGESRGLTPGAIRAHLGRGNEAQARELFAELEAAGTIAHTGSTRGKRYVIASLLSEARRVEAEEEAAKEAAKAEAAARKAKAEAEAAAEGKAKGKK